MVWQKGQSGNPAGSRKGKPKYFSYKKFEEALRHVEKEKRKDFFIHVIERAYKNDTVLLAVLKKVIPDMPSGNSLPDEDWVGQQIEFLSKIYKPNGDREKFKRFYG